MFKYLNSQLFSFEILTEIMLLLVILLVSMFAVSTQGCMLEDFSNRVSYS